MSKTAVGSLQRMPAAAGLEPILEALSEDGGVIIEGMFSAETIAVEHALAALTALSAAVGACADARTVRDVARITGLPRQTVHRWKTEPPGAKRLAQVRDSLRDAGCG